MWQPNAATLDIETCTPKKINRYLVGYRNLAPKVDFTFNIWWRWITNKPNARLGVHWKARLSSWQEHQHLLDVNGPSGECSPASAPRPRHPDALGRSGDRTWIDGRADELNSEQTSDTSNEIPSTDLHHETLNYTASCQSPVFPAARSPPWLSHQVEL